MQSCYAGTISRPLKLPFFMLDPEMKTMQSNNQLKVDIATLAKSLSPMERLQHPIWVFDIDNACVIWSNEASLVLWQAETIEELTSREMGSTMSMSVSKRLNQYKADFTADEKTAFNEIWTLYPNGEPKSLDVVFSGFRLESGRICMLCEVSNQSSGENETLRSVEALLHTSVQISLYAASGEPLYRNPAARSSVQNPKNTLSEHFGNHDLIRHLQESGEGEINVVSSVHTINGVKWHDITARRCMDAVSADAAWLISEVDVSRLKATEEHAQFLAEHDTLTNLPNRNYVSIYFQSRIDRLIADGRKGGLVFLDLDNFKDVNDTLGHDAGDSLLLEVSLRLEEVASSEDCVARLGGDEFLILLDQFESETAVGNRVARIIEEVSKPITLLGRDIEITPSIGIALFPDNGVKIQELMRHADLAMYNAKDAGKNSYSYFSPHMSEAVESRISLESEIRTALKNDEFIAYFQPRVDVNSDEIVGAEALARWQHPIRGLVAPDVFIPVCEASGLINDLGKTIFAEAVKAQCEWLKHGHDLRLSVNLSPLQFAEPNMVDDLMQIVNKYEGDPTRIELEITESVLLGNDQETIGKLHQLVDCGFYISIDDFGTGYSSLAYLHRYPINCLKIDRSFVQSLDTAKPIVELIISMAKLFNFRVVAEGVEEKEQLELLREYQCQEYQGFLFERPIEFDKFSLLLNEYENQKMRVA